MKAIFSGGQLAQWNPNGFAPGTGWSVALMTLNLESEQHRVALLQPLEVALDWGAIGLRRPAVQRGEPTIHEDGTVELSESQEQDFAAYAEVCNVLGCSVMARAWSDRLDRSLFILLDDVVPAVAPHFPEPLLADGFAVIQATIAYAEGELIRGRDGTPQYEHHTPMLLVIPEVVALGALWGAGDGREKRKTEWLLRTGRWRALR